MSRKNYTLAGCCDSAPVVSSDAPGVTLYLQKGNAMENEELVVRIRNRIDAAECMAQLWQQNRAFVAKIAKRYAAYEDIEDLMQEGFIGLCNAVECYDPDGGAKFLTYAAYWIQQAMVRYMSKYSSVVELPQDIRTKINRLRKFEREYTAEWGREPTEKEIQLYFDYSRKEYQLLVESQSIGNLKSIDGLVPGTDDLTVGELVADPANQYEDLIDQIEQQELSGTLWNLVDTLPEEQRDVVRTQYREDLTLPQVSDRLGMDYRAVKTARARAFRELRKPHYTNKLSRFLPDRALSLAYSGGVESYNRTWTSSTEMAAFKDLGW